MAKKASSPKKTEQPGKKAGKLKRRPTIMEFMKKHPGGVIVIHDLKAVMK